MASGPPSPSVGRKLRLVELLLGPLLVFLVSGLGPALGQKVYTNTWAVHIPGGQEEADQIASKHGFVNYGHSKGVNTHTARGPGNRSSKGPAALSHYSALPQRSDGGWDGAEPHTGHRGCNKSQMY
eukprot:superscaffoldBa00002175_g13444